MNFNQLFPNDGLFTCRERKSAKIGWDAHKKEISFLIKDLEDQYKMNNKEMKILGNNQLYKEASHLDSVNSCLEYVLNELKSIK
jgi:hypothetical protein